MSELLKAYSSQFFLLTIDYLICGTLVQWLVKITGENALNKQRKGTWSTLTLAS